MGTLRQDFKQAIRAMRKSPMLTTIAILSLALGIGGTTAIFTVVHQVLLKSFPYKNPDQLLSLRESSPSRNLETVPVRPANLVDWKTRTRVFEDIGLSRDAQPFFLAGAGEPVSVLGYKFSANMFNVLGTAPLLGRTFTEAEDHPGFDNVAVLSYRFWKRQFNTDPQIMGRPVTFSGKSYTVIGVMPPDFRQPKTAELWVPLALSPENYSDRTSHTLRLVGRLRDGVTREDAQQELNSVATQLEREHPDTNKDWHVRLSTLREGESGAIRPVLLALFTAVILVLLIACTNVANLLIARATERHREFSLRVALGATRGRLMRQVLSESLLLSAIGGIVGLLLAAWGTQVLVRMFPVNIANLNIPKLESLPIDRSVLLFCFVASTFTGLLFGLLPALQSSSIDVMSGMRESSTGYSSSGRGKKARNILAIAEISLALILLTGAGLALKSYKVLSSSNFGFEPDHVASFYIFMPAYKYKAPDTQRAFVDKLRSTLATLPGVTHVGAVSNLPLSGFSAGLDFSIEGRNYAAGDKSTSDLQVATPGYFETLRIPILAGRAFTDNDTQSSPEVAVVSASFARQFFPGTDPIGHRINAGDDKKPEWIQIVGVAGDVRENGLDVEVRPEVYVAHKQSPSPYMAFALRTTVDPDSVMSAARQAVWAIDKDQPVARVLSMDDSAAESLAIRKITTWVMTLFAAVSLLLACVGIYGVIAFSVVQRTHEFGIRLAVGATPAKLLALVLSQSAVLGGIGIAIGLIASFALSKLANALVFGVSTRDPITFMLAPAILGAIAMLAAFIPALRASRLDPMIALRQE
jgi:predicted permease